MHAVGERAYFIDLFIYLNLADVFTGFTRISDATVRCPLRHVQAGFDLSLNALVMQTCVWKIFFFFFFNTYYKGIHIVRDAWRSILHVIPCFLIIKQLGRDGDIDSLLKIDTWTPTILNQNVRNVRSAY